MQNLFLAATRVGRYLARWDDQLPITARVPSTAWHMAYPAADGMVQRLRAAGFDQAHVATIRGLPATPQDIFDVDRAEATAEQV
jgi:hypothetical protein